MFAPTEPPVATLDTLISARAATDRLFELVQPDCFYDRPIPERHRVAFYLGHVEAFDWNLIARGFRHMPAFRADFDRLFAFGIDPGPNRLPSDKPSDWPVREEIEEYCRVTREKLDSVWDQVPDQLRCVALEHRLMHAETLTYMLHNFPVGKLCAQRVSYAPSSAPPGPETIDIPAGRATLGKPRSDGFGWDNEFEETLVDVPAFAISKHKVTNGEYLDFVRAGASAPHFWVEKRGEWHLRCLFGEIPLPLDWPVYVTFEEALSYATWIGCRLPTEAQWHRAACGTPDGSERILPWGDAVPGSVNGNFDLRNWDPVAVTATPETDSAFHVSQLSGNGWEWTSTPFEPFPGFHPFAFYPGYSADFFDGGHYVLKGASARTAGVFLRRSFRNWFRPHYPYIYAGFHCVEQ